MSPPLPSIESCRPPPPAQRGVRTVHGAFTSAVTVEAGKNLCALKPARPAPVQDDREKVKGTITVVHCSSSVWIYNDLTGDHRWSQGPET